MDVCKKESVAMATRRGQGAPSHFISANRTPLYCSYRDCNHHVQKTYWKLNSYPPEHPKHPSNNMHHSYSAHVVLNPSIIMTLNFLPTMLRRVN